MMLKANQTSVKAAGSRGAARSAVPRVAVSRRSTVSVCNAVHLDFNTKCK